MDMIWRATVCFIKNVNLNGQSERGTCLVEFKNYLFYTNSYTLKATYRLLELYNI